MTLAPGNKLGPYEILERIGAGGMGEVWKARDTRLGRVVAIKKVKEQHSERFKQEARSIAALNHANICQIFDIGPDYLVLEYVEGKPLAGLLPEKEAVRLAIQITAALEEAHQHGIIHRDLKPSNIMLSDKGSVKLLDFGLAKLYGQEADTSQSPTADFPATQAGTILGTVAYMSPEQAQGQPADARSDIFSFGLVLYEMLSGRRAFSGDSNYTVMDAIVKKDAPPLQASPALDAIVRRCLAKQPSGRYQTASEIKTALEQISSGKATASSAESQPSIAVLPFVNMSGDQEQEYFSDGLTEEIINALTQIPELQVIARTSAFAFKGKQEDITRIAEALRVNTILEGSVRKAGNKIRVTAQLIDASRGLHLWSERYDREMSDVFEIQDGISRAIADKLRIRMSRKPQPARRPTENVEAYNLCLKGRHSFYRSTPESLARSREYFEQAIAIDPKCALAWYGIAKYHWFLAFAGMVPAKAANMQCSRAAKKALELDDALAEAHAMLGMLRAAEFRWNEAESEFLRALELNPKSGEVWLDYAWSYLVPQQRLDEAVAGSKRMLDIDPLSPDQQYFLGLWYCHTRQWDRAIAQCLNALELDPHNLSANLMIGFAYILNGQPDEAIRYLDTVDRVVRLVPGFMGFLGYAYALIGQTEKTRKFLEEMQEPAKEHRCLASTFAGLYSGVGEIDVAFQWLKRAVNECEPLVLQIPSSPFFDPLRSHPHYHALLRRMNLEP
jgi:eukaryotic-like serine/threonine-protein kinase